MTTTSAIRPRFLELTPAERLKAAAPVLLTPALALIGLAAIGDLSIWLTLTVAGLAMGMMIFIMASGLTVVFGLMDIINFGHGAFIAVGAFVGFTLLARMTGMTGADSVTLNLLAMFGAIVVAMAATALMGYAFERVIVKPVYGSHLKQILVTMGGLIVVQQLIVVIWGPDRIHLTRPETLRGAIIVGGAAIEKYRLVAVAIGLALFVAMRLVLTRTKVGLLVRAGVENGEMVEALGYRIKRLFLVTFMVGSALAGLGGVMWGLYQETITAHMGAEIMILVFIVVIIGGLGSVEGCFIGALLVGLMANYTAFLAPKVALVSNIGLMVAVLMWRPQGLYPVVKAK
ncbi:branched-chain amino acid ABC transporter permease [Salinarimonas sp.]|uniref:branched-chain amino acid ABC transporter permease n=1 Tax=Salinarimonas sp. TaxID=2766526 RepID=UPI0032D8BF12